MFDSAVTDALSTNPGAGIDDWGALVLEIVVTALFVMVILTVATDDRAPWKGVMAPLMIGLFIFTAATTVGPTSGGSFNPARSLDPVLLEPGLGQRLDLHRRPARRRHPRRRDLGVAGGQGIRGP